MSYKVGDLVRIVKFKGYKGMVQDVGRVMTPTSGHVLVKLWSDNKTVFLNDSQWFYVGELKLICPPRKVRYIPNIGVHEKCQSCKLQLRCLGLR